MALDLSTAEWLVSLEKSEEYKFLSNLADSLVSSWCIEIGTGRKGSDKEVCSTWDKTLTHRGKIIGVQELFDAVKSEIGKAKRIVEGEKERKGEQQ